MPRKGPHGPGGAGQGGKETHFLGKEVGPGGDPRLERLFWKEGVAVAGYVRVPEATPNLADLLGGLAGLCIRWEPRLGWITKDTKLRGQREGHRG